MADRCSWCFNKFQNGYKPKEAKEADGSIRLMHGVCLDAWKNQHKPVWPSVPRWPDKDE